MGVALNHIADGTVGWSSSADGNWKTLEGQYVARLKSDGSIVSVTGTTAETVLMNNTTIPANALGVGTVIRCAASGTFDIPAMTTVTFTVTLRWGGLSGTILSSSGATLTNSNGVSVTDGWSFDQRLTGITTGASGSAESDRFMILSGNFSRSLGEVTLDTTTSQALVFTITQSLTTTTFRQRLMVTDLG